MVGENFKTDATKVLKEFKLLFLGPLNECTNGIINNYKVRKTYTSLWHILEELLNWYWRNISSSFKLFGSSQKKLCNPIHYIYLKGNVELKSSASRIFLPYFVKTFCLAGYLRIFWFYTLIHRSIHIVEIDVINSLNGIYAFILVYNF